MREFLEKYALIRRNMPRDSSVFIPPPLSFPVILSHLDSVFVTLMSELFELDSF